MKFVYKSFCNFCKHRGSNPENPELALPGRFIPSSHIWYYMKTRKLFLTGMFLKMYLVGNV